MEGRECTSDKALIAAAQQGDRDAGACLYHRHIDRVHRICYRIVLDRSQVADCVQEVWVKVFRQIHKVQCERSFTAWLNRVAANTAIDFYRKHRRRRKNVGLEEVQIESSPKATQNLDNALLQQHIQDALQEMTVKQRTAFVLRHQEGLSHDEIAKILGCRTGTVRTHIQRCLVALRKKLAFNADPLEFDYER